MDKKRILLGSVERQLAQGVVEDDIVENLLGVGLSEKEAWALVRRAGGKGVSSKKGRSSASLSGFSFSLPVGPVRRVVLPLVGALVVFAVLAVFFTLFGAFIGFPEAPSVSPASVRGDSGSPPLVTQQGTGFFTYSYTLTVSAPESGIAWDVGVIAYGTPDRTVLFVEPANMDFESVDFSDVSSGGVDLSVLMSEHPVRLYYDASGEDVFVACSGVREWSCEAVDPELFAFSGAPPRGPLFNQWGAGTSLLERARLAASSGGLLLGAPVSAAPSRRVSGVDAACFVRDLEGGSQTVCFHPVSGAVLLEDGSFGDLTVRMAPGLYRPSIVEGAFDYPADPNRFFG